MSSVMSEYPSLLLVSAGSVNAGMVSPIPSCRTTSPFGVSRYNSDTNRPDYQTYGTALLFAISKSL